MIRLFTLLLLVCLSLGTQAVAASPTGGTTDSTSAKTTNSQPSPRDVVVKAVHQITHDIKANREKLEKDPDFASKLVAKDLNGLVAFKRITRLVMGKWFSHTSREQKYKFLGIFKKSMIDTYASGITLYDGQQIKVLPLKDKDIQGNRAFVRMQLTTNSGKQVPVSYTMLRRKGTWQVENLIVNGLNLGKTFQQQFAQLAQEYDGNIDKVISHWAEQLKASQPVPNAVTAKKETGS